MTPDPMQITFEHNDALIVVGPPVVLSINHYQGVYPDGSSAGAVDATFDFTNLDPEYHELFLRMILRDRTTVHLRWVRETIGGSVQPPPDTRSWYQRVREVLRLLFRSRILED